MPTMSGSVTLVANTRSANQLSGKIYEYLPYDANVQVYAATSANPGTPKARLTADADVAVDDEGVTTTGTGVDRSKDLLADEDIGAGSKLNLTFLSSGTEVIYWIVDITPLE